MRPNSTRKLIHPKFAASFIVDVDHNPTDCKHLSIVFSLVAKTLPRGSVLHQLNNHVYPDIRRGVREGWSIQTPQPRGHPRALLASTAYQLHFHRTRLRPAPLRPHPPSRTLRPRRTAHPVPRKRQRAIDFPSTKMARRRSFASAALPDPTCVLSTLRRFHTPSGFRAALLLCCCRLIS